MKYKKPKYKIGDIVVVKISEGCLIQSEIISSSMYFGKSWRYVVKAFHIWEYRYTKLSRLEENQDLVLEKDIICKL